jgi:hypothetical protein
MPVTQEEDWHHSDQIGRIFAYWVIVSVGQFFENYRRSTNLWCYFLTKKIRINLDKIRVLATVWAIFSQTHLVTLIGI